MNKRLRDFYDAIEIDNFSVKTYDDDGNPLEVWLLEGEKVVGKCFLQWSNGNLKNVLFDMENPPLEFFYA